MPASPMPDFRIPAPPRMTEKREISALREELELTKRQMEEYRNALLTLYNGLVAIRYILRELLRVAAEEAEDKRS